MFSASAISSPALAQSLGVHQLFGGVRAADLCAAAAIEAERIMQVPAYLMQAIALTESGRWDGHDKRRKPWPWAVGSRGESWYFDSRTEAIDHVEKLQKQGISNIDVGCMQINLHYHAQAFADLQEIFNPINNVAYAAIFLNELYRLKNSWTEAVKFYHSATPKFHRRYVKVVFHNWQQLRDQAGNNASAPQLGIEGENRTAGLLAKPGESTSQILPENQRNQEIQTILQAGDEHKQQRLRRDILRYDAFARVQAAQQLERQFDVDADTVPPPLNLEEIHSLE